MTEHGQIVVGSFDGFHIRVVGHPRQPEPRVLLSTMPLRVLLGSGTRGLRSQVCGLGYGIWSLMGFVTQFVPREIKGYGVTSDL